MTTMMIQGVSIDYIMEGEGFPLVLMPEPQGRLELWAPYIPLLGEMCRTLIYAPSALPQSAPRTQEFDQPPGWLALDTILAAFHLERVYLASPWCSWHAALQCGLTTPGRVEALLLVGISSASGLTCPDPSTLVPPDGAPLAQMQVPTLVLTGDTTVPSQAYGDTLARTLPHCTRTVLPSTEFPPANRTSLQPGHAMMRFLLHCERQRTLVRGASFLL